ncbi:MAG: cytochrome c oxidase subunit 3 [Chitinophagaceae bacterium]
MEGILKPSMMEGRKVHPHKFALWLALGSITMMFAGLTSAYIVRMAQGNWRLFSLPITFYISTTVILISSVTMVLGLKAFRAREMSRYRTFISTTLILGILFGVLQVIGFYQLYHTPQIMALAGGKTILETVRVNGNPSESFLFIIAGLHLVHILGGIVALTIVFGRAFSKRIKVYNTTGLEIVATYWHFVDVLWLYLFIFFLVNQ